MTKQDALIDRIDSVVHLLRLEMQLIANEAGHDTPIGKRALDAISQSRIGTGWRTQLRK